MRKYKRLLLIIVLAMVLYCIFHFVNNHFIQKNEHQLAYILKKDVLKGEIMTIDQLEQVYVKKGMSNMNELLQRISTGDYVFQDNYSKGKMVFKNDIISQEEYLKADSKKELISLKVVNAEDNCSYQIQKGSIVNIYYTGKKSEVVNIDKNTIISQQEDKHITFKLLDHVRIVNVYDKNGNVIHSNVTSETKNIDTIMIQVEGELAMKIQSLKKDGSFSLSLIK